MDYQDVKDSAIAYADRHDLEVADNLDTFITLSEARMNRLLRTRKQSTRAYVLAVEGKAYYQLPPDFSGMRDIQLNADTTAATEGTGGKPYEYVPPELMNSLKHNANRSVKEYYTIVGDSLELYPCPTPPETIELLYYQKVPPLTVSSNSNWVSEDHPDMYISGVIAEIEAFVKNYEVARLWYDRMSEAINELSISDTEERWSGSTMSIKVA